jgi:hypothetical protein
MAHEIGHALGMLHTFGSGMDPNYPRPGGRLVDDPGGGLGPFVGVRYTPTISLVVGQDAAGKDTAFDLMSYKSPAWYSPYNYCKALKVASGGAQSCPSTLQG